MNWLILLSFAKVGYYLGAFSFIGINAMRLFLRDDRNRTMTIHDNWHNPTLRLQWICLVISLVGAAAVIPLSAGMLLDEGWRGMTDSVMLQISWESSVGAQTQVRILAVIMAMLCTVWGSRVYVRTKAPLAWLVGWLMTASVFAVSFTFSGHTAEAGWLAKLMVVLHILMAGWWLGSLYPLIRLCQLSDVVTLKRQLHAYGQQARGWVGLLLLSGTALLVLLLLNIRGEVNKTYLAVMGGKIVLVATMLCFAAYHKWYLVANLQTAHDCNKVQTSIVAEAVVGMLVIAVTAILTSSIGIAH